MQLLVVRKRCKPVTSAELSQFGTDHVNQPNPTHVLPATRHYGPGAAKAVAERLAAFLDFGSSSKLLNLFWSHYSTMGIEASRGTARGIRLVRRAAGGQFDPGLAQGVVQAAYEGIRDREQEKPGLGQDKAAL